MALTKCRECGEKISTKAEACPKCGAKTPKRTSAFTWLVLILIIFGVYVANNGPSSSGSSYLSGKGASSTGARVEPAVKEVREPSWSTTSSRDEMTGKQSSYAVSPMVRPKSPMTFPYVDTKAWMAVGCDKESEWAYIGFTKSPNLNNTETRDGYSLIRTRFKWDESVEIATFTQKWGDKFIHFQGEKRAISKVGESAIAVLELDWHGQSRVHFEFPLVGSSDAVTKIRKECLNY